jgi:hypothetical protein
LSNKNIEIILKSSDGSIVQPSIPTLQQTVIKTYDVELMESLSTEVDSLSSNVIVLQNNVSSLSTELDTITSSQDPFPIYYNQARADEKYFKLSDSVYKADLVNGLVPASQLPSFVDDVVEFATASNFPATGETGKIYVAIDTNNTYRWSGSTYVEIQASPGSTDEVAEGSVNLYYTQTRADSRISAAIGNTVQPYNQYLSGATQLGQSIISAVNHAALMSAISLTAPDIPAISYNSLSDKPVLASVAISGSYTDLSNKPTIADSRIPGTSVVGRLVKFSDLLGGMTQTSGLFEDASGNVGIGTTSPGEALDVNGNIKVSGSYLDAPEIRLGSAAYRRIGYVSGSGPYLGYNIVYNTGFKHNSVGAVAGLAFVNGGSIQFYTEGTAAANAAAVEVARFTPGGSLGIGYGDPAARLGVKGSTSDNTTAALDVLNSSGTHLIYARNDGYVGIGSGTSPDSYLHVGYGLTAGLRIGYAGGSQNYYDADTHTIRNGAGSAWVTINGGNVGIGTTNPAYKLDIGSAIGFTPGSAGVVSYIRSFGSSPLAVGTLNSVDLSLMTSNATRVTVNGSTGNVGIGTTSPLRALDICLGGTAYGIGGYAGQTAAVFRNTTNSATNSRISITAGNVGASLIDFGDTDNDQGGIQYQHNGDFMSLLAAGAERVRITSTGVSIGTAITPAALLDIGSSSSTTGLAVGKSVNISTTVLIRGTTAQITSETNCNVVFAAPGSGSFYVQVNGANCLAIRSTGYVGIGTVSPTGILDVNGSIFRLRTSSTPASSGAAGNAGEICWDNNYIYVCTATNTWKRTALTGGW